MRSVVRQSVVLPAPGERLFEMFVSAELHEAFTGSPVTIDEKPGSPFSAFEDALSGTMLDTVKPTLVVLSWRSVAFRESDPDSTLILQFSDHDQGGVVDLIHLDVPDHDFEGVTKGWENHYWTPWRKYLES
ncbi:MAG: SRPBCC domain-containing protein [Pirellulaceae bacterium]